MKYLKFTKNKQLLAIVLSVLLVGCDGASQHTGKTLSGERTYDLVCIDGVEYLYGTRGYGHVMTAHMKTDGSLYLCKSN